MTTSPLQVRLFKDPVRKFPDKFLTLLRLVSYKTDLIPGDETTSDPPEVWRKSHPTTTLIRPVYLDPSVPMMTFHPAEDTTFIGMAYVPLSTASFHFREQLVRKHKFNVVTYWDSVLRDGRTLLEATEERMEHDLTLYESALKGEVWAYEIIEEGYGLVDSGQGYFSRQAAEAAAEMGLMEASKYVGLSDSERDRNYLVDHSEC